MDRCLKCLAVPAFQNIPLLATGMLPKGWGLGCQIALMESFPDVNGNIISDAEFLERSTSISIVAKFRQT